MHKSNSPCMRPVHYSSYTGRHYWILSSNFKLYQAMFPANTCVICMYTTLHSAVQNLW